jgi:hypothetical protein
MEAVGSSEMSGNFQQNTRCNIPGVITPHILRVVKVKVHPITGLRAQEGE